MTCCIYPTCKKRATIGCTCHLGDGWFCEEHYENHLEATRIQSERRFSLEVNIKRKRYK